MKKKQLLTATLVIALSAAVAVNWYYTKNPTKESAVTEVSETVSGALGDSLSVGATAKNESSVETTSALSEAKENEEAVSTVATNNFFTSERLKRDETYDEIIENLEEMAENENLTEEQSKRIADLCEKYARSMKTQSDTESLISAKTGGLCMVIINDEACQVILEKNTLNDRVILQITEIIEKNTNISSKNLTIIEAK
ncbi:MAG: SpoIIIAH-like family protein [Acutalibacteraceae bacterium]